MADSSPTRTPSGSPARVLVADDQRDILESLRFLLRSEGFEVETVTSPRLLLDRLEKQEFDVVLMDLNYARDTTSGQEGLDLLADIQNLDSAMPVVVMTAWASVELAVEAMRRGARDFVEKPWDDHRLLSILETQTALGRALRRSQRQRVGSGRDDLGAVVPPSGILRVVRPDSIPEDRQRRVVPALVRDERRPATNRCVARDQSVRRVLGTELTAAKLAGAAKVA